jgi:hypothetical protein
MWLSRILLKLINRKVQKMNAVIDAVKTAKESCN